MSQFLSSTTSASAEQSLLNKAPTKSWTRLVVVAAATSFALGTFVALTIPPTTSVGLRGTALKSTDEVSAQGCTTTTLQNKTPYRLEGNMGFTIAWTPWCQGSGGFSRYYPSGGLNSLETTEQGLACPCLIHDVREEGGSGGVLKTPYGDVVCKKYSSSGTGYRTFIVRMSGVVDFYSDPPFQCFSDPERFAKCECKITRP